MPKRRNAENPPLIPNYQKEADMQRIILILARKHGWRVYHASRARVKKGRWLTPTQGNPGFPDLILCKPPRLLAVELKSPTGRVQPEQQAWLDALQACGVEVHVWRPTNWEPILRILCGED